VLGVLVLTSPYWVQVIRYHQIQPFLAGLTSGAYSPFFSIFELFYFNFTEELIFPVLAALALLGVVLSLIKRDYLLPVWLVVNALLDARSVNRSDAIPAAMLISVGIVEGVFALILKYRQSLNGSETTTKISDGIYTRSGVLILYLLCAQVALTAYLLRPTDPSLNHALSEGDLEAMAWVKENTPEDAQYLVIPSSTWWEIDSVSEWFPAITSRTNALTIQGSEWLPEYRQRIAEFKEISAQITSGSINIQELLQSHPGVNFLYLPLSLYRDTAELGWLRAALSEFPLVFSNPDVEIYQLRGN